MATDGRTTGLASAALRLFGVVVIAYGISGIVLPDVWLHSRWMMQMPALGDVRSTFLCEFRFLHGREIGVGALALAFHDEILTSRKHNLAFLVALFAAPIGRIYSCIADGLPSLEWLAFLGVEIVMSTVLFVTTRGARDAPTRPQRGAT